MRKPPTAKRIRWLARALRRSYGPKEQRAAKDPLDSLIETVLSQNTSDRNSIPAFRALKRNFRRWDDVRRAGTARIGGIIRRAGLFRIKARRIKGILNSIRGERGRTDLSFLKKMEGSAAERYLSSLPGVGPKTAACVMLFSLKRPYFPVDTHILRLSKRLGLIPAALDAERAHEFFLKAVPEEMMYELHLNMIEHGRRTCHARRPDCPSCVLKAKCRSYPSICPAPPKCRGSS